MVIFGASDSVDFGSEGNVDYGQLAKTYRVGKAMEQHPFSKRVIALGNPKPNPRKIPKEGQRRPDSRTEIIKSRNRMQAVRWSRTRRAVLRSDRDLAGIRRSAAPRDVPTGVRAAQISLQKSGRSTPEKSNGAKRKRSGLAPSAGPQPTRGGPEGTRNFGLIRGQG
jgi:hypothetical protein